MDTKQVIVIPPPKQTTEQQIEIGASEQPDIENQIEHVVQVPQTKYNADDSILKFIVDNVDKEYTDNDVKHYYAKLIEYENKTFGYKFIMKYSYVYLNIINTIFSFLVLVLSLLATTVQIVQLNTETSADILIIAGIAITTLTAFLSGMEKIFDIKNKLQFYKEMGNRFTELNRDIEEILEISFLIIDMSDESTERINEEDTNNIYIKLIKNANIEKTLLNINREYKKLVRNVTSYPSYVSKKYENQFRNKKIIISLFGDDKYYSDKEIILLRFGYVFDRNKRREFPKIKIRRN